MFTGIVEEIGTIYRIDRSEKSCKLTIHAQKVIDDCKEGDSIAVNGTCLTVTALDKKGFTADAMTETMLRTTLGQLKAGDKVNLERSLRPIDRMGGHIVAGHVDGVGTITGLRQEDIATVMAVKVSSSLNRYIAVKGSVCVDGTSLTVTACSDSAFEVWLIPFTKESTILGLKNIGDSVNIEVDMIARYVERLMYFQDENVSSSNLSEDFLRNHGFL
ncbi:riboflavin synthase [Candidatus Poribacteria bacterium]|nr:riboflavin synthase [Candidatus Poribacteria bacterium]